MKYKKNVNLKKMTSQTNNNYKRHISPVGFEPTPVGISFI